MSTTDANARFDWASPIKTGLLGGVAALLLALMGMIEASHVRPIIPGVLSLGQHCSCSLSSLPARWQYVGSRVSRRR